MSRQRRIEVVRLGSTIRFIQGYRYLDRCGEALIRLEQSLGEGWIPGETSPQAGHMQNYQLGMQTRFSSESMTVQQTEFVSFEHFQHEMCKTYDILWNTFDIDKILTPTLQVIMQIGFEELEEASAYALRLNTCQPCAQVLEVLGGTESAVRFTLCTDFDIVRDANPAVQRHRLDIQVLRQERQPDFDERILRRLPLLPVGQQKALGHLMSLRRRHPSIAPAAVQFDVENLCEGEFLTRTFDLGDFLTDSWEWSRKVHEALEALQSAITTEAERTQ